jgi:hypothetical protein
VSVKVELGTATRGAAGVAFEAGAVADQREVAAFGAAVAFVALDAGGADALQAELGRVALGGQCGDSQGPLELVDRGSAGPARQYGQLAADKAARGVSCDLRPGGGTQRRLRFALADRVG